MEKKAEIEKMMSKDPGSLSTGELEELVASHPYSAIAQFFLLHDYSKNSSGHFERQAQKTALFFNNSMLLDWQLDKLQAADLRGQDSLIESQEIIEQKITPDIVVEPPQDTLAVPLSVEALTNQVTPGIAHHGDEPLIPFEPLHTVDYFASQGIKVTEEGLTGDKLGKQLKSFTEWLKSMKKVHAGAVEEVSIVSDSKIQSIAEASNTGEEVLTEAMAEVLVKQGKTGKAIETYRKLSLNNPAKSAYFAAKIDRLNAS